MHERLDHVLALTAFAKLRSADVRLHRAEHGRGGPDIGTLRALDPAGVPDRRAPRKQCDGTGEIGRSSYREKVGCAEGGRRGLHEWVRYGHWVLLVDGGGGAGVGG